MGDPADNERNRPLDYASPVPRRGKISIQAELAFAGAVIYSVLALPAGVFLAVVMFTRLLEIFSTPDSKRIQSENLHDAGRLAAASVLLIASAVLLFWRTRHGTRAKGS